MNSSQFYRCRCYIAELAETPAIHRCGVCDKRYCLCQCEIERWQELFRMMFYPEEFLLPEKWWKESAYAPYI